MRSHQLANLHFPSAKVEMYRFSTFGVRCSVSRTIAQCRSYPNTRFCRLASTRVASFSTETSDSNAFSARVYESSFAQVDELLKLNQLDRALEILNQVKPSSVLSIEADRLSRLIRLLSRMNLHAQVLENCALYEQRASRLPLSLLFEKASSFLALDRAQEAVVSFTHLIDTLRRREFDSDEAFKDMLAKSSISRGLAYMKLGDFEMMLKDVDRAMQVNSSTETRYLRATALANLQKHSEALQEFDRLLETDPRNALYLLGRCLVLSQLGKSVDAFVAVCDAIRANPDNLSLQLLKGRIQLRNRYDFMGAFQTFLHVRERIVSTPDLSAEEKRDAFARSTFGMASSVMGLHGFARAIHLLQDGVQFEPENVVAFSNLAYCYLATDQPQKALETCDQALKIDPNYPDLHQNRASALAALNRLDEAHDEQQQATSLTSQNPTAWADFIRSFKRA